MARDVVEQVRALCALATSPSTPLDEARNAALQAVRRIQEFDLLGHAKKTAPKREAALDRVRMRAHFLILTETEKYFRFCQLTAESRWKGATKTFVWPKNVIHEYTLLGDAEKQRMFGFAGRVTDTLVLDKSFVDSLEKRGSVQRF